MSSEWCTIESDPGVFTCLIQNFGVQNAQLAELYSLDDSSLQQIIDSYGKVHGLVFLFKWQQEDEGKEHSSLSQFSNTATTLTVKEEDNIPNDLFFAKQVIHNACATQALLSILLNASQNVQGETSSRDNRQQYDNAAVVSGAVPLTRFNLGPTLSEFKSFTESFPPELKGEAIGASDEIRTVHNSFARKDTFLVEDGPKRIASKDDDVFHFVAYGELVFLVLVSYSLFCGHNTLKQ
jgi:ubiquitin carboxyl-terminal hydrolase L5